MEDDIDFQAAYGYQAFSKTRYFGFNLHLLVSNAGTVKNYLLRPVNVHDVKMIEELETAFIKECDLLGDKAFFSETIQLSLAELIKLKLKTPNKKNMKTMSNWNRGDAKARKAIEYSILAA